MARNLPPNRNRWLGTVDAPLLAISGGFILLFPLFALVDIDGLFALVDAGFAFSAKYFGLYCHILMHAIFLIGPVLCVLSGGRAVLGAMTTPEFNTFDWGAMIMCTLLVALYTVSAITGMSKGIQLLSTVNVALTLGLLAFLLVFGPTAAIISSFFGSMSVYLQNFFQMAMSRGEAGVFGDPGWLGWWTVFFWGWFMGYGPLMAIFIARISRGRSIRQIVLMLSIAAPLITIFWFTIIGGAGISFEIATPGFIFGPFEGFNLPAGLLAITQTMPSGLVLSVLFLVLTMLFVATTSDPMRYVIAASMSKGEPATVVRAFWALSMGVMALILISTGAGGIGKWQSFIVITGVLVSLLLLSSLWDAVRITLMLGRAQKEKTQTTPAE